jgi:hypothetical protein
VAWERWQDHPRIERTLRETERELGLREVPGRLYRAPGHELPERALDTSGERHAAERKHEMSFADKVRQHVPELRQAQSWEDLAERLADRGLKIEPKGQGIVITDGEQHVRASRVARDLSVNRLEQKFDAPYPGRALSEPGREIDPAIRGLVRDVRAYDEVTRQAKALGEAEARSGEAADHAYALERAASDWRNRADDVTRALGRVYQAPEDARARLAELESGGSPPSNGAGTSSPGVQGTFEMLTAGLVARLAIDQCTVISSCCAPCSAGRARCPPRTAAVGWNATHCTA